MQSSSQFLSPVILMHAAPPRRVPSPMLAHTKRTYQPSVLIRKRRHGFLSRITSVGGRRVLAQRRAKGRRKFTA